MEKEQLIENGYKLIKTCYFSSNDELLNFKNECIRQYTDFKMLRIKSEYKAITKYEIYVKNIKLLYNYQKKYKVKWYDNGEKESIWKCNSISELTKKLNELNIFPNMFVEVN